MQRKLNNYPVMNPSFQVTEVEGTSSKANILIEPLEKGYGHTIGNSLRRVLLSSLPGAAVTVLRIDGVEHQFSTLEGMKEDVVALILKIKQLRIRATGPETGTLRLSAKGEGIVTAKDIECESGFEIVNSDLELAHLAKGKKLSVEMTVESGLGYSMVQDRLEETKIGDIPVDALFSPVIKVNYTVEATRVGRRTDYDKVLMQIETDGTISPMDAIKEAGQILAKQFAQVYNPVLEVEETVSEELSPEEAEVLRLTVEELDLPTRIANALRKGGFKTVGDLVGVQKNTIAKVKNLGEKSVDFINEALEKKGVSLGE